MNTMSIINAYVTMPSIPVEDAANISLSDYDIQEKVQLVEGKSVKSFSDASGNHIGAFVCSGNLFFVNLAVNKDPTSFFEIVEKEYGTNIISLDDLRRIMDETNDIYRQMQKIEEGFFHAVQDCIAERKLSG